MKPNKWQYALVMLVSFCFLATSCSTMRLAEFPGEQTPNVHPDVKVGDTVKVTLKTGEGRQFKVTAVEADALVGKDIRVPYKDMRFLEAKRISGWRSVGLGITVLLAAAGAAFLYLVTHIEDD